MTKQTVPGRSGGTTASLYRLATSDHLCPYGLKTKSFLGSSRRGMARPLKRTWAFFHAMTFESIYIQVATATTRHGMQG